jgi:hypothetical protein
MVEWTGIADRMVAKKQHEIGPASHGQGEIEKHQQFPSQITTRSRLAKIGHPFLQLEMPIALFGLQLHRKNHAP